MSGRLATTYRVLLVLGAKASEAGAWASFTTTRKREAIRRARAFLRYPPEGGAARAASRGTDWHASVSAILPNGQRSLIWQGHLDRLTGEIVVEEL